MRVVEDTFGNGIDGLGWQKCSGILKGDTFLPQAKLWTIKKQSLIQKSMCDIPTVVPAECMEYFNPLIFKSRCTCATSCDTDADGVPMGTRQKSAMHAGGVGRVASLDVLLLWSLVVLLLLLLLSPLLGVLPSLVIEGMGEGAESGSQL